MRITQAEKQGKCFCRESGPVVGVFDALGLALLALSGLRGTAPGALGLGPIPLCKLALGLGRAGSVD